MSSVTEKQANFQWPNSQISSILSEPGSEVCRHWFAKVKHLLSVRRVGGCFTAKLGCDMRFLQSLSFLRGSVAWLNNLKLECVPFVCIPGCHFHDNYSLLPFLRFMHSILWGIGFLSISSLPGNAIWKYPQIQITQVDKKALSYSSPLLTKWLHSGSIRWTGSHEAIIGCISVDNSDQCISLPYLKSSWNSLRATASWHLSSFLLAPSYSTPLVQFHCHHKSWDLMYFPNQPGVPETRYHRWVCCSLSNWQQACHETVS